MLRGKLIGTLVGLVGAAFVVLIVYMVIGSLRRPEVEAYAPTGPVSVSADDLPGPRTYTVDATAHDRWVYFDFSRGSVVPVEDRSSLDWDLAFQRHRMLTNGGDSNPLGQGGVLDLGPVPLDSALEVPTSGYVVDEQRGDVPRNALLEEWYDYSWTSHILKPADRTYAIQTAEGHVAVLRFQGYYCPGGRPGCVTFRYRYRPDGASRFPAVDGSGG